MKKYILISLLVIFVIPSIALASWWNPLSWKIFSFLNKKEIPIQSVEIKKPEEKIDNNELKKQKPITDTTNLKNSKTNEKVDLSKNIIVSSPSITKIEEQPKVETITKKEEIVEKDIPIEKKTINYNSILDFSSIPSDDINMYVTLASKRTGVPSRLLLSILKNNKIDQSICYIKDSNIPILSNNKTINKADLTAFNTIIYNLKIDSDKTALSCDGTIGFGFIPRTWIMISQLGNNLDNYNKLLNPWNPEDVVMEIALWLGSNGGSYKGNLLTGEFNQGLACKNTTWCK